MKKKYKTMAKNSIEISVPWLILIQVTLWVLYYGNVFPTLPWWVVWSPALLFCGIIAFVLIIIILAIILTAYFGV